MITYFFNMNADVIFCNVECMCNYGIKSQTYSCLKGLSVLFQISHHRMFSSVIMLLPVSSFYLFTSKIVCSFGNESSSNNFGESRRFKLILWSIIGATRGGPNRARILNLLIAEQLNSHQIAKKLNLDHKTIRHHLKILTKNELIKKSTEESYGVTYILTDGMQQHIELLKEIVTKMRE